MFDEFLYALLFHQVDYGISMGRRNMGLDLSPETLDGLPITQGSRSSPEQFKRQSTSIPIVITNEDGWCVPYSESVMLQDTDDQMELERRSNPSSQTAVRENDTDHGGNDSDKADNSTNIKQEKNEEKSSFSNSDNNTRF